MMTSTVDITAHPTGEPLGLTRRLQRWRRKRRGGAQLYRPNCPARIMNPAVCSRAACWGLLHWTVTAVDQHWAEASRVP